MVRFSLIPREKVFFELFEKSAQNVVEGARSLSDLVEHYDGAEEKVKRITDLEHQGDAITHQITEQLHRTFVTPLDREDIALLSQRLDDVMDFIEGAATAMLIYRIARPSDRAREMASILVKATAEVDRAVVKLRHRNQLKGILEHCVEINRLENESDAVIRAALAELFDDTKDIVEIIKWREIYEMIENAADRCEDVADILEGVVLKHA